jgi:hypothetical protein
MTERRRYTKRQKMTAVIAAEASSLTEAAEAQGIPKQTLAYWRDSAEFGLLRTKTREDLAEESQALAHKVLSVIHGKLHEFEPRDLSVLYGILTDKAQLLSGHATARTETKTLADTLDDHERAVLRDVIDRAVSDGEAALAAETAAGSVAVGAGAEVRE